jgi:outer membrane protein insertion porin family
VAFAQANLQPDFTRVARVVFKGRQNVKPAELLLAMKTRRPSALPWADRPILREDFVRNDTLAIAAVYRRHGYLDARVAYRIEPAGEGLARVVFTIREGRRSVVSAVRVEGSSAYPEAALLRRLSARPGRPFDPAMIVSDTTRISREYQNRGYIPAVEAQVVRDSNRVAVTYVVDPGPLYHFGEVYISVSGEPTIDPRLIRREIAIEPGEVDRYSRVEKTQEQLSETGFFRLVQLERLVDSSFAQVEWDLRLSERKSRWIDAGVGSGTSERFRFTGEWGNRNLMRRGLQGVIGSRVAFDGRGRFLLARGEVSLLEPWLFGSRTRGQVTPYYERTTDRTNDFYRIEQHRRGVTLRAYRNFGRTLRFQLAQDNVFVNQSVDFNPATLSPMDSARVDSAAKATVPSYTTHRLQGIVERDRRDFPLNPGRGSYQNVLAEIAGGPLQGSSSFLKGDVTSSWYSPLPNGWVLAARLRAGAIDPFGSRRRFAPNVLIDPEVARVPNEDRFRLGGVNTVRGYGEGDLPFSLDGPLSEASGGLALLLANVELRIPVYGPFGLEVFVDAGNVWDRPGYVQWRDLAPRVSTEPLDPGDMRYVVGVGGRLQLPFGPLRYDLSWGLRPEDTVKGKDWIQARQQFAIGPAF